MTAVATAAVQPVLPRVRRRRGRGRRPSGVHGDGSRRRVVAGARSGRVVMVLRLQEGAGAAAVAAGHLRAARRTVAVAVGSRCSTGWRFWSSR